MREVDEAESNVFESRRLTKILADVYHRAALEGEDMLEVAESLESIRTAFEQKDAYGVWWLLDDQIGRFFNSLFGRSCLTQLRDDFLAAFTESQRVAIATAAASDSAAARTLWIGKYARAIAHWRGSQVQRIGRFDPSPELADTRRALLAHAELVRLERWLEAYDFIATLGETEHGRTAALLHVVAGQIHLYRLHNYARALEFFERARDILPEDPEVIGAFAAHAREWHDFARAKDLCRRQINGSPKRADGYVNFGKVLLSQGEVVAAENQFRAAVRTAPGDASGYRALLELYFRKDSYQSRTQQIAALRRQWLLVSMDEVVTCKTDMAGWHRAAGRLSEARSLCDEALEGEPGATSALACHAECDLDEAMATPALAEELHASAREYADRWLGVAPRDPEAYMLRARIASASGEENPASWIERGMTKCGPRTEIPLLLIRAYLERELDDLAAAEVSLNRVLTLDPGNREALKLLIQIADDQLYKNKEPEVAHRAYDRVRDGWGDLGDYQYYNRVGNLHFYEGDYVQAMVAYRRALQVKADDPVLYSNLAGALLAIDTPAERRDHVREAVEVLGHAAALQPRNAVYRRRESEAKAELAYMEWYGSTASKWVPRGCPIRVLVDHDFLGHLLDERREALNALCTSETELLRKRVHASTGVVLPGILFGASPAGTMLFVHGQRRAELDTLSLTDDNERVARFMQLLESEIRSNLSDLLTLDGAARLLREMGNEACARMEEDSRWLTTFVYRASQRLAGCGDLHALVTEMSSDEAPSARPRAAETDELPLSRAPAIELTLGPAWHGLVTDEQIAERRQRLFEETGIAIPEIHIKREAVGGRSLSVGGEPVRLDDGGVESAESVSEFITSMKRWFEDTHSQGVSRFTPHGVRTRDSLRYVATEVLGAIRAPLELRSAVQPKDARRRVEALLEATFEVLRARIHEFISEELVDRYLTNLTNDFPSLTKACREVVGIKLLAKEVSLGVSRQGAILEFPWFIQSTLLAHAEHAYPEEFLRGAPDLAQLPHRAMAYSA